MPNPDINDGWTLAAQAAFLAEYRRTGVVAYAAAAAGLSASGAYRFRRRPAGAAFDTAWAAAKEALYDEMMQTALKRIEEGTPTDIVHRGAVTGTRQVISDRLLMFMLRHLKPATATVADPAEAFAAAMEAVFAPRAVVAADAAETAAPPVARQPAAPEPVATPAPVPAAPAPAPKPRVSPEVGRLIDAALAAARGEGAPAATGGGGGPAALHGGRETPLAGVNRREPVRTRVLSGTIAAVGYPAVSRNTGDVGVNRCEPVRVLAAAGA